MGYSVKWGQNSVYSLKLGSMSYICCINSFILIFCDAYQQFLWMSAIDGDFDAITQGTPKWKEINGNSSLNQLILSKVYFYHVYHVNYLVKTHGLDWKIDSKNLDNGGNREFIVNFISHASVVNLLPTNNCAWMSHNHAWLQGMEHLFCI